MWKCHSFLFSCNTDIMIYLESNYDSNTKLHSLHFLLYIMGVWDLWSFNVTRKKFVLLIDANKIKNVVIFIFTSKLLYSRIIYDFPCNAYSCMKVPALIGSHDLRLQLLLLVLSTSKHFKRQIYIKHDMINWFCLNHISGFKELMSVFR